MKNQGICKYCHQIRHLCGKGGYCSTCYRKYVRKKAICKKCGRLRIIIGKGYCGACYNYLGGYYTSGGKGGRIIVRKKRLINPRKCFFCNENRLKMLDVHHKVKGSRDPKDWVLLCPNHHREVHLGWKNLPVDNSA